MSKHLDKPMPTDMRGVITSWPGIVLSVRLATAIHRSGVASWRSILDDPETFVATRGVGVAVVAEVSDLFAGIGIEWSGDGKLTQPSA